MKKIIAALIAGMFAVGAFAQAPAAPVAAKSEAKMVKKTTHATHAKKGTMHAAKKTKHMKKAAA